MNDKPTTQILTFGRLHDNSNVTFSPKHDDMRLSKQTGLAIKKITLSESLLLLQYTSLLLQYTSPQLQWQISVGFIHSR